MYTKITKGVQVAASAAATVVVRNARSLVFGKSTTASTLRSVMSAPDAVSIPQRSPALPGPRRQSH